MIPDQYPNYYKALEIHTGYFDSLNNMILLSYPTSIVIKRDYCSVLHFLTTMYFILSGSKLNGIFN